MLDQANRREQMVQTQIDEYIWFDETGAVRPITQHEARELAPTHPFVLARE